MSPTPRPLSLALIALTASAGVAAAQDFPEVFPAPPEPTRSQSRLATPPGNIEEEPVRGGLSFDLFGDPAPIQPRCEDIYATIDGERTLVSTRCRDY